MAYKNVAIFGVSHLIDPSPHLHGKTDTSQGSGALGTPVLKALIDSGKFNITAISRPDSKATFPSGVKVVKADYKSVEELTKALQGQDAVVSAVGNEGFAGQPVL
jgi:putative NADH-flavin reductase